MDTNRVRTQAEVELEEDAFKRAVWFAKWFVRFKNFKRRIKKWLTI